MCWTMCTLSSVVSYAASPDGVAKQNEPIPTPHERERPADRPAVAAAVQACARRAGRARRTQTVSDERHRVQTVQAVKTRPEREPGGGSATLDAGGRITLVRIGPDGLDAPDPGVGVPSGPATDIMAPVATATAIPASRLHGHHDRPSMVSVGTIIWLSSELMFFAALFASLLHDPGREPRTCGRRTPRSSTCRSPRSTPRSWCCRR